MNLVKFLYKTINNWISIIKIQTKYKTIHYKNLFKLIFNVKIIIKKMMSKNLNQNNKQLLIIRLIMNLKLIQFKQFKNNNLTI